MIFEYYPIRKNRIRLFQISQTEPDLEILLETFPLIDCPNYTAISYAWGFPTTIKQCQCHGVYLELTPTLHEALRNIGPFEPDTWFWADSICINQRDETEKASLVSNMSVVYERAEKVVVWLGPSGDDSDNAFEHMVLLNNHVVAEPGLTQRRLTAEELSNLDLPKLTDPGWLATHRLFNRPWFKRVWVLQEVALGNAVQVQCGQLRLDWRCFTVCAFVLTRQPMLTVPFAEQHADSDTVGQAIGGPLATTNMYLLQNRRTFLPTGWIILHILLQTQSASERLDYVYGVRALLPQHMQQEIEIDYSQKSSAAYWKVHARLFALILREGGDMPRICFPIRVAARNTSLPTWCPDWVNKDDDWMEACLPPAGTGAGRNPFHEGISNNSTEQVPACVISETPELRHLTNVPVCKIEISDDSRVLSVTGAQFDTVEATLPANPSADNPWRDYIERALLFLGEHPDGRARLPGILLGDHNWSQNDDFGMDHVDYSGHDILDGFLQIMDAMEALEAADPDNFDVLKALPTYYKKFMSKAFRDTRMLARTKNGRFGSVARTTQPGDSVCIFFNAEAPFILSPVGSEGYQEMRGPAFIEGVMNGELFDPASEAPLRSQRFHLV